MRKIVSFLYIGSEIYYVRDYFPIVFLSKYFIILTLTPIRAKKSHDASVYAACGTSSFSRNTRCVTSSLFVRIYFSFSLWVRFLLLY